MKKQLKTLGERLKYLREEVYRQPQAGLASGIGLKGHVGIYKIETGQTLNPQQDTIDNICELYGTTREWLMHGEGEMLPNGKKALSQIKKETGESPWRDEAYQIMKQENERLWGMINRFMNGELSFLSPVKETA